ncbi:MAG: nucleotidyl transferase AbiEii/AbiGii toxin family protein [Ignavibacteria bacterium]
MKLDFLTDKTKLLFERFSSESFFNDYTLVGGTALSLQIEHRHSEDLDFIFDGKFLKINSIKKFLDKNFKGNYKILKQDNDHQIDFIVDDVKVTFFTSDSIALNFSVREHSQKFENINIATVEIISVLKINTLSHRNTIRDYYDLYFISKYKIPLEKIFEMSKKMLPHLADITYTETIVYVDELNENSISEHLHPKEIITKSEISNYFTKELKKIYN